MRNKHRNRQPEEGICMLCGTIVKKQLRIPLRQMQCPKCKHKTIIRKF